MSEQSTSGTEREVDRKLVEQKVRQMIYGGDAYDAVEVFEKAQYEMAERMLSDYIRDDGDELVQDRVQTALDQINRSVETEYDQEDIDE